MDGLDSLPPIRIACDVDNQYWASGATAHTVRKRVCMTDIEQFEEQIKEILNIIESHRSDIFELSKVKGVVPLEV